MSLRTSVGPFLLALALAAGACGDSADSETSETVDANDAGMSDASDETGDSGDSGDSESADSEPAASDPAQSDPAASDPAEDNNEPAAAGATDSSDLESAISAWVLSDSGYTTEPSDGDCVAEGIVGGIGAERLAEIGVTPEDPSLLLADMTDEEGDVFIDSLFDCVDMRQAFIDNIVGPDLTEDEAGCVTDEMGMDFLRSSTKTGLLSPGELDFDELTEVIEAAGDACGVDMDE